MKDQLVVYIDDSETELVSVRAALEGAGYRVTTGSTIDEIVHALSSADLILIDYHMPGMRGDEVRQRIYDRVKTVRVLDMPLFYLYTSDRAMSGTYRDFGFDGQCILKGNPEALPRQLEAAFRMAKLRKLRPGR